MNGQGLDHASNLLVRAALLLHLVGTSEGLAQAQVADSWQLPLDGSWTLSHDFYAYSPKRENTDRFHVGQDVPRSNQAPVFAAANGIVTNVGWRIDYGWVVVIEHLLPNNSNVCSVYGHLREAGVASLGKISKGDRIGYLTDVKEDYGTGIHLHFGIREGAFSTSNDPEDQKWRYRGYAPASVVSKWHRPSDFVTARSSATAAAPSITSIVPSPVTGQDGQQTITIQGADFKDKPAVSLSWTGQPAYVVPTERITFENGTQLKMLINTTANPDTWTVHVTNPDGQSSGRFQFEVVQAPTEGPPNRAPTLAAITDRTVAESQTVTFTAQGSDPDTEQSLTYSLDAGFPSGASIDPVTGVFTWMPNSTQGGTTYTISIRVSDNGSPPLSAARTFRVTVSDLIIRPANDNFANRTVVTGTDITVNASNVNATREPGEPFHADYSGNTSLWWSWTAPATGDVTMTTAGSSFDTMLGVYTGSSVSRLTEVASDDDSGGNRTSRLTFTAVGGTTYQIAVDGYNGKSGNITLRLTQSSAPRYSLSIERSPVGGGMVTTDPAPAVDGKYTAETIVTLRATSASGYTFGFWSGDASGVSNPVRVTINGNKSVTANFSLIVRPANDNFASRTVLSGTDITVNASNVNATREPGEPFHDGWSGSTSVWWSWTAPATADLTVTTAGSSFDTMLGVYTGTSVSSLTRVASDDDSGGNGTSRLTFTAVGGRTYQIAVDGYNGRSGNITLKITTSMRAMGPMAESGIWNSIATKLPESPSITSVRLLPNR